MLMEKKTLLGAILDLYEQAEAKETPTTVEPLNQDDATAIFSMTTAEAIAEKHFIAIGREQVLKNALHSWHNVTITPSHEQTYDEWLDYYLSDIPSWISLDDFCNLYSEELHLMYDADLKEAREKKTAAIISASDEPNIDEIE